jgi:hypothetical protein
MQAGVIRRTRQTLHSINLAEGALAAWKIPSELLNEAFDTMARIDPFTGHIVIRSAQNSSPGSEYRLWTTIKIPVGLSIDKHCQWLAKETGAQDYQLLPAKKVFSLGVGHIRRKGIDIGARSKQPPQSFTPRIVRLSSNEWQVLDALRREFTADEIKNNIWEDRARELGVSLDSFFEVASELDSKGVIGRFSTFLEHSKPSEAGIRVTGANALFQWSVPPGMEEAAGEEIAYHLVMTHVYWRAGGEAKFDGVNLMGAAHAQNKEKLIEHFNFINKSLLNHGITILTQNIFWGERNEIHPSEISLSLYEKHCKIHNIDPS